VQSQSPTYKRGTYLSPSLVTPGLRGNVTSKQHQRSTVTALEVNAFPTLPSLTSVRLATLSPKSGDDAFENLLLLPPSGVTATHPLLARLCILPVDINATIYYLSGPPAGVPHFAGLPAYQQLRRVNSRHRQMPVLSQSPVYSDAGGGR